MKPSDRQTAGALYRLMSGILQSWFAVRVEMSVDPVSLQY